MNQILAGFYAHTIVFIKILIIKLFFTSYFEMRPVSLSAVTSGNQHQLTAVLHGHHLTRH